jgi:hypothetical protein
MKFFITLAFFISLAEARSEKNKWSSIISNSNGFPIRFTSQAAEKACKDYLFGDWRLPTIEEAERDVHKLYVDDNYGESCIPWSRFSCQGHYYWSSSQKWGGTWVFPIEAGFLKQLVPNTNDNLVRCVTKDFRS